MTNPEREAEDWWHQLPEETRESLNESARTSIIDGLVRYPYWDLALCAELLAWSQLESGVLEAHGAWLSKQTERHQVGVIAGRIPPPRGRPGRTNKGE